MKWNEYEGRIRLLCFHGLVGANSRLHLPTRWPAPSSITECYRLDAFKTAWPSPLWELVSLQGVSLLRLLPGFSAFVALFRSHVLLLSLFELLCWCF
jgi:hypothetical protein